MKKLMKKKVSLFGKEFSVFAIAVVSMMVLVSAALVPYLSNVIGGSANIESPLVLSGTLAGMSGTIHGGDNLTKVLNVANLANASISYSTGFIVTGPANSNWTNNLDEFVVFNLTVEGGDVHDMRTNCGSVNNILTCDLGNDTLIAGNNKNYTVDILFHEAIMPGNYGFKARVFTTETTSIDFDFTTS